MIHAVVYLRDQADFRVVCNLLACRLPHVPLVVVHAPVCRPGWLIEMECMAVVARDQNRLTPRRSSQYPPASGTGAEPAVISPGAG